MSLTFFDGMNELQSLSNPGFNTWSPNANTWSTNIRSQATYQLTAISALTKGTQVTCRIILNGTVMDEQTTVGPLHDGVVRSMKRLIIGGSGRPHERCTGRGASRQRHSRPVLAAAAVLVPRKRSWHLRQRLRRLLRRPDVPRRHPAQ